MVVPVRWEDLSEITAAIKIGHVVSMTDGWFMIYRKLIHVFYPTTKVLLDRLMRFARVQILMELLRQTIWRNTYYVKPLGV